tara:strand:+ start:590 stop:1489 length:900 start_codon:yes stop_codon:yes gene_type:complete
MKVSVVICTYNREVYLPECLLHLKNQTENPENFEIVLVDNNSSDSTAQICKTFISENPNLDVTYVKEENPGLSFARNCGIKTAKGDLICFIDDDGFAVPEYVETFRTFALDDTYKEYIAFGGKVIPRYNEGKHPKWLSPYLEGLVSKVDMGNEVMPFIKKYPVGCNMGFRSHFFEKHGGFNTNLHTRSDEKFVFDKLKKAELKTLYVPKMEVEHFIDDHRLEHSFIVRLSKIVGQSEAIRLKSEGFGTRFSKVIEYLFKLGASYLLAFSFLIKGQVPKAKYIVLVRWYVLTGFFIKSKI